MPKKSIGTELRGPEDFDLVWDTNPGEPDPDAPEVRLYGDEEKALVTAQLRLGNDLLQQGVENLHQDREERRKYSGRIFWLVIGYLLVAGLLIFMAGLDQVRFRLADSVLMVLIGSTTASVIGLFAIVTNYLFPRRG